MDFAVDLVWDVKEELELSTKVFAALDKYCLWFDKLCSLENILYY